MKKSPLPSVLVVDDKPDEVRALKTALRKRVEVVIAHPQEIGKEHLAKADLVLVDLRLDRWPQRDALQALAFKAQNGLALAAVLRAHAEALKTKSPKAFAIYSGHLADLSGDLPPETREHIIARAHNLEWAFAKAHINSEFRLDEQIESLAKAIHQLPTSWPKGQPNKLRKLVWELLGLSGGEPWAMRSWRDIEKCHPPVHELSEGNHGLAFLRWLLHRIFPYPCFLWDMQRLALRLRVTQASLANALNNDERFRKTLKGFQYRGILSGFLGPRWWRSGTEAFLWALTRGNPFDPGALRGALISKRTPLEASELREPVICVDSNYTILPQFSEINSAVRIQPDDWPVYADQAWTTIELAKSDSSIGALVIDEDMERLNLN